MNVRLLRKVAKHIAEEPRRINMNVVASEVSAANNYNPPCGTIGCIAGWACVLSGISVDDADFSRAIPLLGLKKKEAFRLFAEPRFAVEENYDTEYEQNLWPLKLAKRYERATTPRAKANAVVARIEHFIKTKGAE